MNKLCQTESFRGDGFYGPYLSQTQEGKPSSLSTVAVCFQQLST